MSNLTRHILLPALVPLLFIVVVATPMAVLGCRNRGLLALIIAFASVLGALSAAIRGAHCRLRRDSRANWWLASSLILAIAPVALLLLA